MKLNPDCIRDVLICVEEIQVFDQHFGVSRVFLKEIYEFYDNKYSAEELYYTVVKLGEANLLKISVNRSIGGISVEIKDITYTGHEFVENIRNQNNWETIKEKATSIGSLAIPVIQNIASTFIANKLN